MSKTWTDKLTKNALIMQSFDGSTTSSKRFTKRCTGNAQNLHIHLI